MPILATNKDAPYKYELEEKFEAGIALLGPEVKSIRAGKASLKGSYVTFRGSEPYLLNCTIAKYPLSSQEIDPQRTRKLLLKKHELLRLQQRLQGEALTILPVSLYTKGGFIKVELALGRGKRKADKRETIKQRDAQRRIQRALRQRA